jgi:hypothetical protein
VQVAVITTVMVLITEGFQVQVTPLKDQHARTFPNAGVKVWPMRRSRKGFAGGFLPPLLSASTPPRAEANQAFSVATYSSGVSCFASYVLGV